MFEMYNLDECLEECMLELDALRIAYGKIKKISVNPRLSATLGFCKQVKGEKNTFVIEIAPYLVDENLDKNVLKEIIIHELLHSCPNCMDHGERWQRLAKMVNDEYPQYHVHTAIHPEEHDRYFPTKKHKYVLACEKCGFELTFDRTCPKVRYAYLGQLRHTNDHGTFYFKEGRELLEETIKHE
jgi:hypothetical protein